MSSLNINNLIELESDREYIVISDSDDDSVESYYTAPELPTYFEECEMIDDNFNSINESDMAKTKIQDCHRFDAYVKDYQNVDEIEVDSDEIWPSYTKEWMKTKRREFFSRGGIVSYTDSYTGHKKNCSAENCRKHH